MFKKTKQNVRKETPPFPLTDMKDNRWRHGQVELVLPSLPDSLCGSIGCFFQQAIFDSAVGMEVYLTILENGKTGSEMVATRPFNLLCKTGLGNTSYGPVAFLIWTAAAGSPRQTIYEQFMNPLQPETVRLLKELRQQIEIKTIVLDSAVSEVLDFFLFTNNYDFGKLADFVEQIVEPDSSCDFQLAQQEFRSRYLLEELIRM